MAYVNRLAPILALISFLIAGSWGNAPIWITCTDSDGTVHLEALRCGCDEEPSNDDGDHAAGAARPVVSGVDVVNRDCSDEPLLGSTPQHSVAVKSFVLQHVPHTVLTAELATARLGADGLGAPWRSVRMTAAPIPCALVVAETTVLHC